MKSNTGILNALAILCLVLAVLVIIAGMNPKDSTVPEPTKIIPGESWTLYTTIGIGDDPIGLPPDCVASDCVQVGLISTYYVGFDKACQISISLPGGLMADETPKFNIPIHRVFGTKTIKFECDIKNDEVEVYYHADE